MATLESMEETMSEIISAIKRLIETWLTGKPPKILHDESQRHEKLQNRNTLC